MIKPRPSFPWSLLLRFALGAGILIWLFKQIPAHDIRSVLATSRQQWPWWVAGITCTFLALNTAVWRWRILLHAQGMPLPFLRVFNIFYIGQFFNAFMPGACGGDIVRAAYVAREAPGRKTEAISTVLVDRGIGLLMILIFSCVLLLIRLSWLLSSKRMEAAGGLMWVILLISLVGLVVFFRRNIFEHRPFLQRFGTRTRLGHLLLQLYNAFYVYRNKPLALVQASLLSLANLVGLTLACYAFGQSLDVPTSLLDYFTLFPIITALSAIPITPGALGIRESLFAELFAVTGARAAQTVPLSLMVYLGGLFWSLFGGLIFIAYSAGRKESLREEWRRLREDRIRDP